MHDYAYYLGFDEPHWNSQQYDNGLGGAANDGLLGNSQAGAATGSRDNANMSTGADGLHARTNMFLWQSLAAAFYAPCVDGDYDFGVFGHEFGHMIENRMIAKGVGARQGNAAGAMGEAFGDFDALEVMNALHIAPVPGSDRYTEGAYVTGNPYNGIRDFLAGRPMGGQFPQPGRNPDTDPLNYGDFGFDLTGPEVHADGEIWVAVQMDLRDLFLQRYPSSGADQDIACVRGRLAASDCPGDRRWIQDYYDAMVLMPRRPTMIDARDAMLAADQARFGGANQDLLWQGFAMRGFGQLQSTVDANDTDPVPDFSSPLANNATLNFSADSKSTELPVSAKIYVGDYQARVDADRGHRSWHHRGGQPRQHRAVRPERGGLAHRRQPALDVLQLHRGRAGLRNRPVPGEEPPGRRDEEHHDPLRAELRVRHERCHRDRRHARHEHEPRERDGRRRGDDRRPDGRARRRPLDRDPARRRRPERLEREAARRLGAARPEHEPLHGAPVVHGVRLPRGEDTGRTRPATARSPLAGRRSCPLRRTRSRP